ncbi:hypothetical protein F4809DRAFT_586529 [Biscogniauxia mediterranea]|nr:hypothetical protein F4809DRAFT_586529 [Biscogniauxia mediterranea]
MMIWEILCNSLPFLCTHITFFLHLHLFGERPFFIFVLLFRVYWCFARSLFFFRLLFLFCLRHDMVIVLQKKSYEKKKKGYVENDRGGQGKGGDRRNERISLVLLSRYYSSPASNFMLSVSRSRLNTDYLMG